MTTENVTPLTGAQPDSTYHPNLNANEAMDAAIAEIERLEGDGRVTAQLIEAREAIRADSRQRKGEPGGGFSSRPRANVGWQAQRWEVAAMSESEANLDSAPDAFEQIEQAMDRAIATLDDVGGLEARHELAEARRLVHERAAGAGLELRDRSALRDAHALVCVLAGTDQPLTVSRTASLAAALIERAAQEP